MKNIQRHQTGRVLTTSCVNTTGENAGCGVLGPPQTFGKVFNDNGGGVVALSLLPTGIRQWVFSRDNIPDLHHPDPSGWGTPIADFPGTSCDIATHFTNLTLALDVDLCGGWAGGAKVFARECQGRCIDWASEGNGEFGEAYWEIGGIWVWGAV